MRIIRGRYQRRQIIAPNNLPVRPTTDMAKESLFNILENYMDFPDQTTEYGIYKTYSNIENDYYRFCKDAYLYKYDHADEYYNNFLNKDKWTKDQSYKMSYKRFRRTYVPEEYQLYIDKEDNRSYSEIRSDIYK